MATSTKSANVVQVSDTIATLTFDFDKETQNTVRYNERRDGPKNTIYLSKSKFKSDKYPATIVVTYRALNEVKAA